jgi:hypothetical protein
MVPSTSCHQYSSTLQHRLEPLRTGRLFHDGPATRQTEEGAGQAEPLRTGASWGECLAANEVRLAARFRIAALPDKLASLLHRLLQWTTRSYLSRPQYLKRDQELS